MIPRKTHFSCGCESDSTGVIKTCDDVLCDCGHVKKEHLFGKEEHCKVVGCKCERFDD